MDRSTGRKSYKKPRENHLAKNKIHIVEKPAEAFKVWLISLRAMCRVCTLKYCDAPIEMCRSLNFDRAVDPVIFPVAYVSLIYHFANGLTPVQWPLKTSRVRIFLLAG